MKRIEIAVVLGTDGPSLQVLGLHGGVCVYGPKAWGNPHNHPEHKFVCDADELIRAITENAYDTDVDPDDDGDELKNRIERNRAEKDHDNDRAAKGGRRA